MASSPRTSWTGAIQCGLLNVPVTVGKASGDSREKSLQDVCAKHHAPINRSERCTSGEKCDLSEGKRKAVYVGEQKFHVFDEGEISLIEDSTNSDTLEVLDAQPLGKLPILFGLGTYYVRAKDSASETAFAVLMEGLEKSGYGLVSKMCNSARQKLCILHAHSGILFLTQVPMHSDWRAPGAKEKAHHGKTVSEKQVNMLISLFDAVRNEDGFDYEAYSDEGIALRDAAVQRVMSGEPKDEKAPAKLPNSDDLMADLEASIEKMKS
jgi:non-homologous end joining protein Ku